MLVWCSRSTGSIAEALLRSPRNVVWPLLPSPRFHHLCQGPPMSSHEQNSWQPLASRASPKSWAGRGRVQVEVRDPVNTLLEDDTAARRLAWPEGGHPVQTPAAWRKAKARTRSDFRSESVWSEMRELRRHPGLKAGSRARVANIPEGAGAQSGAGVQAQRRTPSSRSSPKSPGSRAAAASGRTAPPLGKEAAPAPPRAAPTSSRKNSFPKPELGTSVLPSAFYVGTCLCRP